MQWIEDFLGVQNLGNYHGTGAFNVTKYPTWDSILLDMMRQKNGMLVIFALTERFFQCIRCSMPNSTCSNTRDSSHQTE